MSEPKLHAEYSASGSKRWVNCHGSIQLSRKCPPSPESSYAKEGTEAHTVLEYLLKNRKNAAAARKFLLRSYPSTMVGNADFALGVIEDLLVQYAGAELLCETKADYGYLEPGQFGTLDAAIVQQFGGTLLIIDYKYGQGVVVEPKDNTQLILYALAVAQEYDHDFEDVELIIIQPRAEGKTVKRHRMTINQLLEWEATFKSAIKETKKPNAALKTGDWCQFCPAAKICPEVSKKALARAKIVFQEDTAEVSFPNAKAIAIPLLGEILDAGEKIDFWLKEVRAHAQSVLERGHKVKGWKLVDKRGTRKYLNMEKATKEAKAAFGKKAFTEPELLSPAQFEKVFTKPEHEKWLAKRVSNVSSGLTMVPESHPSPAVNRLERVFGHEKQITGGNLSRKDKSK